jgi:hypothetical protein
VDESSVGIIPRKWQDTWGILNKPSRHQSVMLHRKTFFFGAVWSMLARSHSGNKVEVG